VSRDAAHRAARRQAERAGVVGMPCARCGYTIQAGQLWDLDHVDELWVDGGGGRTLPSHQACNRAHGARLGNQRRGAQRKGTPVKLIDALTRPVIRRWPAAGIEVEPDQSATWVVRAAVDDTLVVTVDCLPPIPGTRAVVERVTEWWSEWQLEAIGIDPRSPSSILLGRLGDAGMPIEQADAPGVALAHGKFLELLRDGRLRIRGHKALDTAAGRAQERKLAGSTALQREHGAAALNAAELAVLVLDTEGPASGQPSAWVI